MKSKKAELTIDKVVILVLAVIAIATIAMIIFLNKDKMADILAAVGRIMRFKS